MQVLYSDAAERDFERIRDFFLSQGISRNKVNDFIDAIDGDIFLLASHPNLGFSVGGKYDFVSEYRALLVWDERYLAVYEIAPTAILVRRIYSTKENYIRDLLP